MITYHFCNMGKISKLFQKCLQSLFRCRTLSDILLNTIYFWGFLFIFQITHNSLWASLICKWWGNSLIFVKIKIFLGNLMHSLQWCYNFIADFNRNLKNSLSFPFQASTNVPYCCRKDKGKFSLFKSICHVNQVFPDKKCPINTAVFFSNEEP